MANTGVTIGSGVNFIGGITVSGNYSGVAFVGQNDTTVGVLAYAYDSTTGFGTKYSDPSTSTSIPGGTVAATTNGDYVLAVGGYASTLYGATTGQYAYRWDKTSGFGTKITGSSYTVTGTAANFHNPGSSAISQDGTAVATSIVDAVSSVTTNSIRSQVWNSTSWGSTSTVTGLAGSGAGGGSIRGMAFSPAMDSIVCASSTRVNYIRWTKAGGFGTVGTAVGSGSVYAGITFNRAGNVVAATLSTTPYVKAWQWVDATTGFGTQFSDPATYNSGSSGGSDIVFSPTDDAVIACSLSSMNAWAWNNTTGFGAKYSDPSVMPTQSIYSVAFSPLGDSVMFGSSQDTVSCYRWNSATGFGTKLTSPASGGITAGALSVAFSPG